MARAAGEVTKKRRNSKNYGGKRQPQNAKTKTIRSLDSAGLVALAKNLGRVHTIAVAPSALTDPEGADVLRGGLPALDPALFTEHVHLLHQVIVHFKIRRGAPFPSKQEIIDFLESRRLPDGSALSARVIKAMVTIARPRKAMIGGRPPKQKG
jgi:hypothetical protein